MFTSLSRRFLHDRRGNVAIIFAMVLLPIVAMIGAAIDYKRTTSARAQLLSSLDAALLALGSSPPRGDAAAQQFLKSFIDAQLEKLGFQGTWTITGFKQSGSRISADLAGSLPTTLMGLLGIELVSFDTSSAVVREQKKVELALVLDNTGSMGSKGKMEALRAAASSLVDIMYEGERAAERVKIALVPFVTGVNIKAPGKFSSTWMDEKGQSRYHGINFDETLTSNGDGNGYSGGNGGWGSGGSGGGGSGGGSGGVGWWGGGWGGGGGSGGGDDGGGTSGGSGPEPLPANHFKLFEGMPNVDWKGCVEARPEPYDTNDTPPSSANPDTLWVPWFWPDEPDLSSNFHNDYLADQIAGNDERQLFTGKYNGFNADIDDTPPETTGPNKSCGQPILPLTNDTQALQSDIADMSHWSGSGTNIAQGLVWGWRVLSPSVPFTEGVGYEEKDTLKAIVLLSDGENIVSKQSNNLNYSDYNPYNYLSRNRLGTTHHLRAADEVDNKVAEICRAVKDKEIRVYTILFDLKSQSLQTLFRDCATSPNLYFDNPSPSELETVFAEIAYDLSKLRLER
ncbi:TadE/TadG family type IV pilus assembly protein [Microbaculum marinisediminis]|nr:TadE/TadG family type IV pilus assembly protein [Microbaculum sp. A6E488]